MSWDAIIFDCDGVLVDSERVSNRVLSEMLGAIGLPLTLEQTVDRFVGRSMPTCLALIEEDLGSPPPEGFAAEFHRRTVEIFERELELVPGVLDVLDWLPWTCCVASSGDHAKLRATLTKTGLYARMEGRIYSAHDVPHGKPHPDLFLHAAQRMGARAERCAVIEDAIPGVQAGLAAGMTVFGFGGTIGVDRLREAGAHTVFHDMKELPSLLEWYAARAFGPLPV